MCSLSVAAVFFVVPALREAVVVALLGFERLCCALVIRVPVKRAPFFSAWDRGVWSHIGALALEMTLFTT